MKRLMKRFLAVMITVIMLLPDFAKVAYAAVDMNQTVTLSISGDAKEGQTLRALMDGTTPTGVTFEWARSDSAEDTVDGAAITDASENSYTLTAEDVGKYIYVTVRGDGSTYSEENYCISEKTAQVSANVSNPTEEPVTGEPVVETAIVDEKPEDDAQNGELVSSTVSDNSVSDNSVSDNSVSDNSVSDNSVSDNSVSDNTISGNEIDNWVSDNTLITGASGLGGYATGSVLSILGVTGLSKCTWYHVDGNEYPATQEEADACKIADNRLKYTTKDTDLNKNIFAVYEKTNDTASPKTQYVTNMYGPIVNYQPTLSANQGSTNQGIIDTATLAEPVYTEFNPCGDTNELGYRYEIKVRSGAAAETLSDGTDNYERRYISLDINLPSEMTDDSFEIKNRAGWWYMSGDIENVPGDVFAKVNDRSHITVNVPLNEGAGEIAYRVGNTHIFLAFVVREETDQMYAMTSNDVRTLNPSGTTGNYIIANPPEISITGIDMSTLYSSAGYKAVIAKSGEKVNDYKLGALQCAPGSSITNLEQYISIENGPDIMIKALKSFTDTIILPIYDNMNTTTPAIELQLTNGNMNSSPVLVFGTPEDVGHPEKAIDSIILGKEQTKSIYVSLNTDDTANEITFSEGVIDTLNAAIELNHWAYIEAVELVPQITNPDQTIIPAYVELSLDGSKAFNNYGKAFIYYLNFPVYNSETNYNGTRYLQDFPILNMTEAGPVIGYYNINEYPPSMTYVSITDAKEKLDLIQGSGAKESALYIYRSWVGRYYSGNRNQFEVKNLNPDEYIDQIVCFDSTEAWGSLWHPDSDEITEAIRNEACDIVHADGSNQFTVKFRCSGVAANLCLITNQGRKFNIRMTSTAGADDSNWTTTFFLDNQTYGHPYPKESHPYLWYMASTKQEHSAYKNKSVESKLRIGIQQLNGSYWSNDADLYISSVNVSFTNQIVDQDYATENGAATGDGEGRVAWFDLGNGIVNSASLTPNGDGTYLVPIRYGYNTGAVIGVASITFKNGLSVPKAIRGKTIKQYVLFNVQAEKELSETLEEPEYYTDTQIEDEGLTSEQAAEKHAENYDLFCEYYNANKTFRETSGYINHGISLPDDVTFLNTTGSPMEVSPWVSLYSSRNDAEAVKNAAGGHMHAPRFVNTTFNITPVTGKEDALFHMYGIEVDTDATVTGDLFTGDGALDLVNCYFNLKGGSLIGTTAGSRRIRENIIRLSGSSTGNLVKLGTGSDLLSFENNDIDLQNSSTGSTTTPLFNMTVGYDNQYSKAVIANNKFTQTTSDAPTHVYVSNTDSGKKWFDMSNNYFTDKLTVVYDADQSGKGILAREKTENTGRDRIYYTLDNLEVDLVNQYNNTVSTKQKFAIMSESLDGENGAAPGTDERYLIHMHDISSTDPLYTLSFTSSADGFDENHCFMPYGTVESSHAAVLKKLPAGNQGYRVLTLSQNGSFPTDTQVKIPVDSSTFAGTYCPVYQWENGVLYEMDQVATLENGVVSFDVTEGGSYVVAAYNDLFKLALTDADGDNLTEAVADSSSPASVQLILNRDNTRNSTITEDDFANIAFTSSNANFTVEKGTGVNVGTCTVNAAAGKYGSTIITASYTNPSTNKVTKTAKATVNFTTVTYDEAMNITPNLEPGRMYAQLTAIVQGPAKTPVQGVYLLSQEDNFGNRYEVQGNDNLNINSYKTEKATGGVKLTVTFNVNSEIDINDAELSKIFIKLAGGAYEIPVEIRPVVKVDNNRYIVKEIAGENKAILISVNERNMATIPDTISYGGGDIDVIAIAAGALNKSTDGTTDSAGPKQAVVGSNVAYIGIDVDNFDGTGENYQGLLCDGSGTFGRLEEIYVDPANATFDGNNPSDSGEEFDTMHDYNLYLKNGSDLNLCEYPAFSRQKEWTMLPIITSYIGVKTDEEGYYANTNRMLEYLTVGDAFEVSANNTDFINQMNQGNLKSFAIMPDQQDDPMTAHGYHSISQVLYRDEGSPLERRYVVAYPAAKQADAILLTNDVTNIYPNALTASAIKTLVIPDGLNQNGTPFRTNATQLYLYTTGYTDLDNVILAPMKGVTLYADATYKTWATGKKYTFKPLTIPDETAWTLKGKSQIVSKYDSDNPETILYDYMYVNVGDTIKIGDAANGFAYTQNGTNIYTQQYDGQISYKFDNNYNTDHFESAFIFNTPSDQLGIGNTVTVMCPGVNAVEIYSDDDNTNPKRTLYIVAKPKTVSVASAIDLLVPNDVNTDVDALLQTEIGEGPRTTSVLDAYHGLGLYETEGSAIDIEENAIAEYSVNPNIYGRKVSATTASTTPITITTTLCGTSYKTTATVLPIARGCTISLAETDTGLNIVNGILSSTAGTIELPMTYSQEGNTYELPESVVTVTSSNTNVLTVACAEGSTGITLSNDNQKSGEATLTCTLTGDPLGRKAVKKIKVVNGVVIGGMVFDLNDNGDQLISHAAAPAPMDTTLSIGTDCQFLKTDSFSAVDAGGVSVESTNYSLTWTSSDTNVMRWDSATDQINVVGEGVTTLTATLYNKSTKKADASGLKTVFHVAVRDIVPKLGSKKYTVSNQSTTGTPLDIVLVDQTSINWNSSDNKVLDQNGNEMDDISISSTGTIVADSAVATGTYKNCKIQLSVTDTSIASATPQIKELTGITLTVNNAAPQAKNIKLTVPAVDTYYYLDDQEPIIAAGLNGYEIDTARDWLYTSASGGKIELLYNGEGASRVYRLNLTDDITTHVTEQDYKTITLQIPIVGYVSPVSVPVTLNFLTSAPKATTNKTALTIDAATPDTADSMSMIMGGFEDASVKADFLPIGINSNTDSTLAVKATAKQLAAWGFTEAGINPDSINIESSVVRNQFVFTMTVEADNSNTLTVKAGPNVAAGTYQFTLTPRAAIAAGDTQPTKTLTPIIFKVTVKNTKPKTSLSPASLTLNRYAEEEQQTTFVVKDTVTYTDRVDYQLTGCPKAAAEDGDQENISLDFNNSPDGQKIIRARAALNAKPGVYKFSIAPEVSAIGGESFEGNATTFLPAATLTVTVKETLPKITYDTTSLTIDNSYPNEAYQINMSSSGVNDTFDTTSSLYRTNRATDTEPIDLQNDLDASEPDIEITENKVIVKATPTTLAGTYTYYIAPGVKVYPSNEVTEAARTKLTIKITTTRPKAKAFVKDITLNNRYASGQTQDVDYVVDGYMVKGYDFAITGAPRGVILDNDLLTINSIDVSDSDSKLRVTIDSETATGDYLIKVVPKIDMTIRGNDYNEISLEPMTLKVKVVNTAPTLKIGTAATLYAKYDGVIELAMEDPAGAIDQRATVVDQFFVNQYGKTYRVEGERGDSCYAVIDSLSNGDLCISAGDAAQFLTKDLTMKNLAVTRTLLLAQQDGGTIAYTDTRKLTITIKATADPTATLDKKTLVLNKNLDLTDTNLELPENTITLGTTAGSPAGTSGAYITRYAISLKGAENSINLKPVTTFTGTTTAVTFKAEPLGNPKKGDYTFTLTPYISPEPADSYAFNPASEKPLKAVTVKITLTEKVPTVTYNKTQAALNVRNMQEVAVICADLNCKGICTDVSTVAIGYADITPISKPKGATDEMTGLEFNPAVDGGMDLTARIYDENAVPGNYVYNVKPVITDTEGRSIQLAIQKITVNVSNALPTAAFRSSVVKVDTTTNPNQNPSVDAKVVFSGSLADQITGCHYGFEPVAMPKGAMDGSVWLEETDTDDYSKIIVRCADPNVVKGIYTFRVTPYPESNSIDFSGMKTIMLTVNVTNSNPKPSLYKASMALNALYEQQDETNYLKLSVDYSITDVRIRQTGYPVEKGTLINTRGAVGAYYDSVDGVPYIKSYANTDALAGTYTFEITPIITSKGGTELELATIPYKVVVNRNLPKVKLQSAAFALNHGYLYRWRLIQMDIADSAYGNTENGLITTIDTDATMNTLTYTGKKNQTAAELMMQNDCIRLETDYDSEAHYLKACLNGLSIPAGSYSFTITPIAETCGGTTIELAKQKFTVNVSGNALSIALKSAGGKLDLSNRDTSALDYIPVISDSGLDEVDYYSAEPVSIVSAVKGEDYSNYFWCEVDPVMKRIHIRLKDDNSAGTTIKKGSYPVRVKFTTVEGKEIYTPVILKVDQSAVKIAMDRTAVTLYKSAADSDAPALYITSAGVSDCITGVETTNPYFTPVVMTDQDGQATGFTLKFAGSNASDANTNDKLLAAEARGVYKAGSTVTVPVTFVTARGSAAATVHVKVTVQN